MGRSGIAWLRARGNPPYLSGAGDYGGIYVGIGMAVSLGKHFVTGPDVMALLMDGEGTQNGSGVAPSAAWRIGWQF